MIPIRRVLSEKRPLVLPLAVAALVNLGIYVVAVYPLSVKVAGAEHRTALAEQELQAAGREHTAAQALLTGKDRADAELKTFYKEVLPADLSGARRITYLKLAQLARDASLRYERRSTELEPSKDGRLSRLKISMALAGEYENVRRFIYQLESAPEFVVIDDVALAQSSEPGAPLVLNLELSTYYRTGSHGS